MKTTLAIKGLIRSPIKTALTFILICAVSFAFFSQAAEYAATTTEMANAAARYVGVGSAEAAPVPDVYTAYAAYIDADPRVSQQYSEEQQGYSEIRSPSERTPVSALVRYGLECRRRTWRLPECRRVCAASPACRDHECGHSHI